MKEEYFFIRKRIFKLKLLLILYIFSDFVIFNYIYAQSVLSDPEWFQKNILYSEKKTNNSQNTPIFPSDLFFTPLFEYNNQKNLIFNEFDSPSFLLKNKKNKSDYHFKKKYNDGKLTESMLNRLFPWFSNEEISNSVDNNNWLEPDKTELADIEFSGIFLWVSIIQDLLISDPEKAQLKFLEFEEKLDLQDRSLLKVQLYYFLNEWSKAEKLAKAFLREKPNGKNIPLIYYYLNKSLLSQGKNIDQNLFFRELTIKFLKPKVRSDFLKILSNDAYLKGDFLKAVKYLLDELRNQETSKFADKKIILRLLKELRSVEELDSLSEIFPNLVWLQDQILYIKVSLLYERNKFREATSIVESKLEVAKKNKDQNKIEFLNKIYYRLNKSLKINTRKIGVVLPLSSSSRKIAQLAQETLNGLWIALHANEILSRKIEKIETQRMQKNLNSKKSEISNVFELSQKLEDSWELVVRDSHLNEDITKNAIHELVEDENVIAIVGPLARKTSEAAAEVAQKLRVPLISLSLTDSIPKLGDYIFRNNKSWKEEVSALVGYAVSELQACRFVILFAKTREGRQKMKYFWEEALKEKCEIVALGGFEDEGQKSLVNEFDTFTGKNHYMDVEDENILKELKEKEDPTNNFDAVFVAVGSGGVKNLRLIFPYSSVYKMEKTIFLGDSGWNDFAIQFAPGLKGIIKPIFVDSFFLGSKSDSMDTLINLHEKILYKHQNYVGPTSYTAYAYDTLMILLNLLKDKSIQSYKGLKESLLNMKPFPGVTGNLTFDKYGEVQRELKLLTLRRGKIEPLFKKEHK